MTERNEPRSSLLGLRHLALRVSDMGAARGFYQNLLGMTVVWEPDPDNVYLTSGCDNLALHLMSEEDRAAFSPVGQSLDHFGFIVENPEAVQKMAADMEKAGVRIVKPFRQHRDGSSSFYMADPDGNVIQILFEPKISPMKLKRPSRGRNHR